MLLDMGSHARYLIALPLLVIAEAITLPGLATIAHHFGAAGLIAETSRPRYDALLDSTRRLLASPKTDIVILLLAYLLTLTIRPLLYPVTESTWVRPGDDHELSLAGWWGMLVSQPIYLVLMIGWFWRVMLWGRFLGGASRLELKLVPSHPDHAGGLGFAGTSIGSFLLLAFALSVTAAGGVVQGIKYGGMKLSDFYLLIAGVVITELLVFVGPLVLLATPLLKARTRGILQYDALAKSVGHDFEQRWLRPDNTTSENALTAPDFSATTDLYSITANVHEMRLVPVRMMQLLTLLVVALLPFVPALLMTLPLQEFLKYLAKLVF